MAFKFIAVIALVSAVNAGLLPVQQTHQLAYNHGSALLHHEEHAPAHYDFEYSVSDVHTGDQKHQQESRRGDAVHGQYSLVDSDGHLRTVDYSADDHSGFNAHVRREPLGHNAHHAAPVAIAHHATPLAVAHHAAPIAVAHHAAPISVAHHAAPLTIAHHAAPLAVAHHVAPVAAIHAAPVAAIHSAPLAAVHHATPIGYSSASYGHDGHYSQGVHHNSHNDYYHH